MKPLTNNQKRWIDVALNITNSNLSDMIRYCHVGIILSNESTFKSWHDIIFYQGIIDYLTWPKVG